jgi:hypothetical protein
MMNKRAQVWYTDFIIGVLIFSIVIFAYFYYVEHTEYSDDTLEGALLAEAKTITGYLMGTGYPQNWTAANVSTVGLTNNDYRIDQGKLDDFNSWNYEERRAYLHTTKDYYFFLEYLNGSRFNELCYDPTDCVEWNTSYNLVQNTRLLIYDHDIVRMSLYVYQKP